jgi:cytochrome c556
MQEKHMGMTKHERRRVDEAPPVSLETPAASQEAPKSTEALGPLSTERNQELSDTYEKINDVRRELVIVEGVIADKEARLSAKESKGYQESRDRMRKRLEDLEKKRDRIAKEADPADAEAIRQSWERIETAVPAPAEEPESGRQTLGTRLADGFNELMYKLKPKSSRTDEDWDRHTERHDRRVERGRRAVAARYDAFLTECEAELEKMQAKATDLKSLSDRALKARIDRLFKRGVQLHHMTKFDSRGVPALRPEVRQRVYDAYDQLEDAARNEQAIRSLRAGGRR